jgi:hypothetical protein
MKGGFDIIRQQAGIEITVRDRTPTLETWFFTGSAGNNDIFS